MKHLFLFFLCLSVSPVLAQNSSPFCTTMSTRVHVRTKLGTLQYITQFSREDFLRKAGSEFSPYTLGLTSSNMDIKTELKVESTELLGQICVTLSDVYVEMGYPSITVYIDKKYKPSSCAYQAIKEHEDYHVAVFQQALTFFRQDVEDTVAKTVSRLSPKIVYSQNEIQSVTNKFVQSINSALRPLTAHINKKLTEKNAAIDTQEMYQETTAVCQDW